MRPLIAAALLGLSILAACSPVHTLMSEPVPDTGPAAPLTRLMPIDGEAVAPSETAPMS